MSNQARILSIGTAVPPFSVEQSDAALIAQQLGISERWREALPALYRKTGVQNRSSVLLQKDEGELLQRQAFYKASNPEQPYGPSTAERMQAYTQHAGELLHQASREAFEKSDVHPQRVTHLITISCTGFSAPGVDHHLFSALGLRNTVQRTHVGFMGCHGAINGLRIAKAIAESNQDAVVLVGAVELCSLHQQYSDHPQQLVANALFADGAASVLVTAATDCMQSSSPWRMRSSFSLLIPGTSEMMSWRIGNYGFEMQLSAEVPSMIEKELNQPVSSWLADHGISRLGDVSWAIHPGGPRILDSVASAFQLDATATDVSRHILASHGNMSSPTVLFILNEVQSDANQPDHCVLLAFGPGLHTEAILLEKQ